MDTAVTITFDKNGVSNRGFSGLGKNDAGKNVNTIIDGSPTNTNWWLAIGALNTIGDKIPGPHGKLVSKVELFMKRSQPSTEAREKRSVLEQRQLSFGFQDLYDFDREKRDIEVDETQEEIELRSYGSQ